MRTLVIALMATLISTPAWAKKDRGEDNWARKDGVVGLGAGMTLPGHTGAQFRYFFTPDAGLLVTLGANLDSGTIDAGSEVDFKNNNIWAGIYGEYKILKSKKSAMAGVLGIDFDQYSYDYDGDGDSWSDIQIGLGLKGECFLHDRFSIYSQLGLAVDPYGSAEENEMAAGYGVDANDIDMSGMQIYFGGGLLGSAGFTYWFN